MTKRIPSYIVFILLICAFPAFAATRTWDGSSSNLWNLAANWAENAVPTTGDALVFPSGAANISTSNDIAAGTSFASITFGAGASAYTLAGNAIILSGGATAITASNTSLTMTISLNITFSTSAPTITVASGGTLAISGTIANGGLSLTTNISGTATFSGLISGSGAFTTSGSGTVTLSNNSNSYSGGTKVGNGTLIVTNTGMLGTGDVSSATPGTGTLSLRIDGAGNNGTITMGCDWGSFISYSITFDVRNNGSGNTGNAIAFGGQAQITGNVSINFTGANGYQFKSTGGFFDNQGSTNTITLNPTTASFLCTGSISSTTSPGHIIALDGTATGNVISSVISEGNPTNCWTINKTNTSTWNLSGANTTVGVFNISGGILQLGVSSNVTGSGPLGTNAGGVFITSTGALDLNGYSIGTTNAEPLSLNSTGTASAGALINSSSTAATYGGLITLAGASSIKGGTGTIAISNVGTITGATFGLTLGGAQGGSITSIIGTTSGTITKQDAGTWTLSGVNTYTGATTISAGILAAGSTSAFGSNSAVTLANVASTSLNTTGYNNTIGSITGGGTTGGNVTLGAATLTIGGDNSSPAAYAGVISGTGAITKSGTGTLTLSGTSTYTGTTAIQNGRLSINTIADLSTSSAIGAPTTAGNGTIAMGSTTATGILVYTGTAQNTNRVINLAGTTGGATIDQSGTGLLKFTSACTATGTGAKTLTLQGSTAGTGEIAAAIVDGAGATVTSVTKVGSGTWTLSGTNTYSGATTVSVGTLSINTIADASSNSAIGTGASTAAITIGATGTLNYTGTGHSSSRAIVLSGSGGTIDASGSGALTLSGGVTGNTYGLVLAGTGSATFSGVINTTTGTLTKSSSGTWTLSGANTYTGTTTISAGTLKLGAAGVIPDASAVTVTGTLDMNTFSETVGSIAGAGTIDNVVGAGTPTLTSGGDGTSTTFSGVIQNTTGTLGLSKAGAGTLTLSGANTYTGTTTISAGTLQLGAAARISNSSNVVMSGGYFSTGSGAGYAETAGTITLTAHSRIVLGTGSHSLNFAASNGATWTAATLLRITGWQGSWNSTTGTSGKIYTGSSAELSAGKLAQIFFTHPISGMPYTAIQLGTGEVVPTSTLPVKLVSFTGEKGKSFNELFWITASEINSEYFEVQRSSDGVNFESIGTVKGAGNSNNILQYSFVDYEQPSGTSYYRLKQFDYDGQNETFNTVAIDNNSSSEFKMNALFPNPANASVTVNFQASELGSHFIFINDAQGNEVFAATIATLQGDNKFQLPTQNYASGTYFVRIVSPKKESISSQIVVQH